MSRVARRGVKRVMRPRMGVLRVGRLLVPEPLWGPIIPGERVCVGGAWAMLRVGVDVDVGFELVVVVDEGVVEVEDVDTGPGSEA
jgi:hypothetical protein